MVAEDKLMLKHLTSFFTHVMPSPPFVIKPKGRSRGCVVISYLTWPFRDGWDSPKARGHTNAFEVTVMAEAYRDLGFRVEVIDCDNTKYVPPRDCRIAIDIHGNLERWHESLPSSCTRVLHATGSHWLLWNQSELSRLERVRDCKGRALLPRRQVEPTRSAEIADHIVVLGNSYTIDSFSFTAAPCARVPISSAYEFPWPEKRDFDKARKKFLWLGSYGMVHKGLDLTLEAFAGMPELELTVCGRPEKEEDFMRLYLRELQNTPNIRLHGWMDMSTSDFSDIARKHASVIYPSSAEGGAGSVIHCAHAGMLPISTTEASVDLGNFGVHVAAGTVDAVQSACRAVAEMSPTVVEARARGAYEHVRKEHTREKFRENYRNFAAMVANGIS